MALTIEASGQACGASVTGVDLSAPLDAAVVAEIRAAWLDHLVLAFPDQRLSDDDLERFTLAFGGFGDDPFIAPIPGRTHIIAVARAADETAPVFAETWHSDWSFQKVPPAGTCLYSLVVPPVGGDTLFANQQAALAAMPAGLRARLAGVEAVHSAALAYAPEGQYGDRDEGRTMVMRPSAEARAVQHHPVIRTHPESGREAIFGCAGYILDLVGTENPLALLRELYQWQTRPEFVYRHRWQKDMLLMWDNRAVLHMATGGYQGHARLLHRTTIADRTAHAA